jgi:signal peptidase I
MTDQDSPNLPVALAPEIGPSARKGIGRKLLVVLFSVLLPGAGHLYAKRRIWAALLFLLFSAFCLFCLTYRVAASPEGAISLVLGAVAFCIFAGFHAVYGTDRGEKRPSIWWFFVVLFLGFFAGAVHSNWILRASGFRPFIVPSRSMENTAPINTRIVVDVWYYKNHAPEDGAIVIFQNREGLYFIKRVIARGGETIASNDGEISVNGKKISEPYVIRTGGAPDDMNTFGPLKIPAGKLFVMGDNRDISLDSRDPEKGPIDESTLRGKAIYMLGQTKDAAFKTF